MMMAAKAPVHGLLHHARRLTLLALTLTACAQGMMVDDPGATRADGLPLRPDLGATHDAPLPPVDGRIAADEGVPDGSSSRIDQAILPVTGTVVVTPSPGVHPYRTPVAISAPAGATVYYTLDGSTPTKSSRRYDGPITLSSATSDAGKMKLRVIAIAPGKAASPVASADYTLEQAMIVHLKKPADWASPYVHYWDTAPGQLESTWPGIAMKPEGDGWFYAVIDDQTSGNVVFSDKGAHQTDDVRFSLAEGWFVDGDLWDVDPRRFDRFSWPGGKYKALVISMDDGPLEDRRLVALLDKYKIRGTFHLNSGKLGDGDHVRPDEVKALYAKHEVSTHSATHPYLTKLTRDQIDKEIRDDRAALEKLTGAEVRGHAYPFGDVDDTVVEVLSKAGIVYGRVVPQTKDLRLPNDLMRWKGSCHHTCAWDLAKQLSTHNDERMALLFIWGHSFELDANKATNSWKHVEDMLALLSGKQDIWYATALEVADYLRAIRTVRFSLADHSVENPSSQTLWIDVKGKLTELKPKRSLELPQ